jgi:CBS domain-containing protein
MMKAWITTRRVKPGSEDEFRRRWAGGPAPKGMTAAYLLEDDAQTGEVLSLSLWENDAALRAYQSSSEAAERTFALTPIVDDESRGRSYTVYDAGSLTGAGRARLLLPVLAGTGGTGAWLISRRIRERRAEQQTQPRRMTLLAIPAALIAAGTGVFFFVKRLRGSQQADEAQTVWGPAARHETASPADRYGSGALRPEHSNRRLVCDVIRMAPHAIDHNADLRTAEEQMRTQNIDALAVMADGRLAGIITARDLAAAPSNGDAPSPRVGTIMSDVPVTITSQTPVEDAIRLMNDRRIHHLPVVDGADLVGIVTLNDLSGGSSAAGRTSTAMPAGRS